MYASASAKTCERNPQQSLVARPTRREHPVRADIVTARQVRLADHIRVDCAKNEQRNLLLLSIPAA